MKTAAASNYTMVWLQCWQWLLQQLSTAVAVQQVVTATALDTSNC